MGRRLALLIATDQYEDAGLRRLTAPGADAEAFAAVLRDPDIAGFDVTMLTNQPYHRVGEAIGDFYRDRRRDDLMLLYFTGHGLKDDDGRLFLAMTNTKRASLLFTSVSAEQIDHAMKGCASRQTVLVLDCCYSGAFPAGRLAKSDTQVHVLERFQGRGRTVLTASDATQYSFEGDQLRGEAPGLCLPATWWRGSPTVAPISTAMATSPSMSCTPTFTIVSWRTCPSSVRRD